MGRTRVFEPASTIRCQHGGARYAWRSDRFYLDEPYPGRNRASHQHDDGSAHGTGGSAGNSAGSSAGSSTGSSAGNSAAEASGPAPLSSTSMPPPALPALSPYFSRGALVASLHAAGDLEAVVRDRGRQEASGPQRALGHQPRTARKQAGDGSAC